LKKITTTFAGTAVLTTAIVGALALCAWFGYVAFKTYLDTPHTYGETTVTPYGHQMDGPLTHTWDSLQITTNGKSITLKDPNFDLTILGDEKGLKVAAGEVNVKIETDSTAKVQDTTSSSEIPEFPKYAKFYLPVGVDVGKLTVDLDSSHWEADDIAIHSGGMEKASVKVKSIKGDHLAHEASVDLNVDFENENVKLKGSVVAGKDSIALEGSVPKNNLTAVSTKVDLEINNPEEWVPGGFPSAMPPVGKLKVTGNAKLDPKTHKPRYDVTVKTRVGAFWPLDDINVQAQIKGTMEKYHIELHLTNDEDGVIDLVADLDENLDGTGSGKVERMSAMFGPQMMPMDLTIHSAEKKGNVIQVSVETRQGSVIDGTLHLEDPFNLTYVGDMSPYEPWALDWSRGRLVLQERFKIFGSFADGKMKALVKIDTIPFAYQMTADSLQTFLVLNKHGIDFTSGTIYSPKETFDFTGDVKWDGPSPHTSWKLYPKKGGYAEAYIHIMDSTTIDIKIDSVEVSELPFANIKFSDRLNGKLTGTWVQNFDTNVGELHASVDGNVKPFTLQGEVSARQNGDTVFIDKAEATQSKNRVEGEAVFILPNDSNPDFTPTGYLPIQVVHAWASSKEFNIPLLLEPLGDTTFASGLISGDISYNQGHGLQGNVDFSNVDFKTISPQLFNVRKMNLFAEANKVELNAYLGIGGGGWTGNTQIIVDNVFDAKRHVSASHNSDNGGDLYAEGFLDTSFTFKGNLKMNGSWFIPGTMSEVTKTDFQVDVDARLKEGIKGITADFKSDSTLFKPSKTNYLFPLKFHGHMEDGLLSVAEAVTSNDSGETVRASLQFDLDSLRLRAIDFESKRYTLRSGPHILVAENINGHLEDDLENLTIMGGIQKIRYNFHDDTFGDAEAFGHGDLNFTIPHAKEGQILNKTISGNLIVDKLVYHKELEIEVTPNSMDKFLTMFNNAIAKLRSKEAEVKVSSASPINLSIHVSESQSDSIQVVTPFANFPFTFDVWVLGSTNLPLLRGDISNSNSGFIGVKDVYQFDLSAFRISWADVPWQHGVIDVTSQQELPYCTETTENEGDTCPINLDIQGTITNPQPNPSSNCGNESSAAALYYNIFLGCIADDTSEDTDWNKLAGKAIGKVISTTANKTLGGDYIGDIDMKVMLFNSSTTNEKDSSYFKLPISLDRWVKDLSLILGYTQDQSENPTYDQSLQFGLNYTLPVFKEKEYSHKNHLSPTLSLFGMLVSKQYLTNTGTESNENRVEKNVGINYVYRYWNPCLLGIGHCETIENPENQNAQPKPPLKKTETKK